MINLIDKPTRIFTNKFGDRSESTIDCVATNLPVSCLSCCSVQPNLGDHLAQILDVGLGITAEDVDCCPQSIEMRSIGASNIKEFKYRLDNNDWCSLYTHSNVDDATEEFMSSVFLSSNKTKTLWRIVNDRLKPDNRCRPSINLTRNNTLITDAREISQEFGDYFSSVAGGMVADQFGTSTLHPVAVCPAPCSSFTFGPVCAEDIIAVVNKIPNKTSYGDDGISSHLLKQIIGHIAEYLAFVYEFGADIYDVPKLYCELFAREENPLLLVWKAAAHPSPSLTYANSAMHRMKKEKM
ncbi:hypothetical protein QE152_g23166 [Popillia japonica]|uniref:Uncharacterized protein n=1 Tax=Popillia japonica TaxID=7064 RepID=A0AAW1KI59_POPJA